MSRERELLERAYQYIPMSSVTSQEIRAYLAQTEPTQDEEPVAWIREVDIGNPISALVRTQHGCGEINVPLYTRPAPQRSFVRLSEEEIADVLNVDPIWLEMKELVWSSASLLEYARSIEDALEEKNRG